MNQRVMRYLWQTRQGGLLIRKPNRDSRGCLLRGRRFGELDRGSNHNRETIDRVVQSEAGYNSTVYHRSGIHRIWRGREGWSIDETTLERVDKRDNDPNFEDRQGRGSQINLSVNIPSQNSHILHKYHYIRTEVRTNQLSLEGMPGKDNWADFLTKSLLQPVLEKWRSIVLGK
jgi:hypothetical protein